MSTYFGKVGISPSPLSLGWLSDEKETPFILMEYIEGASYQNLQEMSTKELKLFRDCLETVYALKPSGLRSYYSPLDYMLSITSQIASHPKLSSCSDELSSLIRKYKESEESLLNYAELLGSWSMTFMHGDLWVPNVIFHDDRAFLLDFEDCALGEMHLDLARLIESSSSTPDLPNELVNGFDELLIQDFRPIGLGYIIGWSLERLLSMEAGFVESNLNLETSRAAVMDFTLSKVSQLKSIF
jgi:aminoglycoside phosphotransferase (APT) family kinase protein